MSRSDSHNSAHDDSRGRSRRDRAALEKGREMVIGIVSFTVIISGVALFLVFITPIRSLQYGLGDLYVVRLLIAGVRFLLTIGLCTCLYRGYQWARMVTIVLFFIATLIGLVGIYASLELRAFIPFVVAVVATVGYGLSAYLLLVSPNVHRFLRHQRHLREEWHG